MFYMARSGRIYLPEFELDSECRRIAKKFDGQLTRHVIPFPEFTITEDFLAFWLDYFGRRHGTSVLPRERLMHWLNFGIISHVGAYKDASGNIAAYTLEVSDETMTHDWYQSWSPAYDKSSIGMWLLIDIARAAKARGAKYYYSGTVYGGATDYKTNLPNLEYWNGESWIKDANNKSLRARAKGDSERQITLLDEWKQNHPLF
jgi:arginyl-tRNA--protein-N-Asp/Glu arginylyltransferase